MLAVVRAGSPVVRDVVAGHLERREQLLVGQEPVADVVVQIARAVLQVDAQRLRFGLADERREVVTAAEPDVGADGAEHQLQRKRTGGVPAK